MSDPSCLIIDADGQSAHTLAGIVGRHGFSTHIIAQPFDALLHLRTRKYDLILFDMSPPDSDGPFVLEQIKREMPEQVARTVIVSNVPLSASDIAGGVAIIGKTDLKPMMRYLID
jgi:CheY-like chemotaxis protein